MHMTGLERNSERSSDETASAQARQPGRVPRRRMLIPVAVSTVALVTAIAGSVPAAFAQQQEPAAEAGSARGSRGETGARTVAARAQAAFGFQTRETPLTVPYGVDPATWLNGQDGLYTQDGRAVETSALKGLFKGGAGPLTLKNGVTAYPAADQSLSGVLSWAQTTDSNTVLPAIEGIDAVAKMADASTAPEVPAEVLGALQVTDTDAAGGQRTGALKTTGSSLTGDLVVWIDANDVSANGTGPQLSTKGESQEGATFSASPVSGAALLKADGTFQKLLDEHGLSSAGTYYVKLGRDVDAERADGGTAKLYAGQVLRLDVHRDETAPTVSGIAFADADGKALDLSKRFVDAGTLYLPASGFQVTATVRDPEPAQGSADQKAAGTSGVGTVELVYDDGNGKEASIDPMTDPDKDGKVTFKITAKSRGEGTYDLSKFKLRVTDAAGNQTETALPQQLASGEGTAQVTATKVRLADAVTPSLSIALSGLTGASATKNGDALTNGETVYSNKDSVTATLGVADSLFEVLRKNSSWTGKNPLSYMLGGKNTLLSTDGFKAGAGDTYADADAVKLSDEGRHELSFSYDGIHAVDGSFENAHATDNVSVVIDRTDPAATGVALVDGYKADTELAALASKGEGTVLIGGARTFTVDVADAAKVGLAADAASGVDSVTVTTKRHGDLCADDDGDTVSKTYTAADLEGGKLAIELTERGVYKLSDIELAITDKAGNTTKTTLAKVVDAGTDDTLKAFDRVAVDNQSSSVEVSAKLSTKPIGGTGDFHAADTQLTFTVDEDLGEGESSFFDAYAATKNSVALSGSFTGATHNATAVDFSKASWTADGDDPSVHTLTVPFERKGSDDDDLPDGSYQASLTFRRETANSAFKVDSTAPQLTDAKLEQAAGDGERIEVDGKTYLSGTARSIRVRVQDLLPRDTAVSVDGRDEAGTSGVDDTAGKATYTLARTDDPAQQGEAGAPQQLKIGDDGWATITLDEPGAYSLSGIVLHVPDRVGNVHDVKLSDLVAKDTYTGDLKGVDAILVADKVAEAEASRGADLRDGEGAAAASLGTSFEDRALYGAGTRAYLFSDSFLYRYLFGKLEASYTADGATQQVSGLSPRNMKRGKARHWELEVPFARTDGKLADGTYSLSITDAFGSNPSESSFTVDTTAPRMSAASITGETGADRIADMGEGTGKVLVGTERSVRVRVQDLLPGAKADEVDAVNQADTAGVKSVRVRLTRSEGMPGDGVATRVEERDLTPDAQGYVTVDLSAWGYYQLKDIVFTVVDNAGNELGGSDGYTLADYARDHASDSADALASLGLSGIVVADPAQRPAAKLTVTDAKATPASKDPYFHRGAVSVRLTVTDPWLDVYRHLPGRSGDEVLSASLRANGAGAWEAAGTAPELADFKAAGGTGADATWAATYVLPATDAKDADGASLPREGDYAFRVDYPGVAGLERASDGLTQNLPGFGVDYTAPVFGALTLSQTAPVPAKYPDSVYDKQPWGWIFSTQDEGVSLAVTDAYSGVDDATSAITSFSGNAADQARRSLAYAAGAGTAGRTESLAGTGAVSYGSTAGTLAFAFSQDGTRMNLDGTSLAISDRAGNTGHVALGAYRDGRNSNVPSGVGSVTEDRLAPAVSVSFDNNDVRNGKYYNAARTATVTVDEANFDILREHDPKRSIARIERDGNDAGELTAEDFKPKVVRDADGDAHLVWQATYTFKDDADWHLEVGFEDGAGRASNTVSEDFTVDTQAPTIMVTYDNDDVANGMYYKARRTATIQVSDRNFSPEGASVRTEAKDASGAAAAAPGDSGWQETEPRQESRDTVSFNDELHYRLRVAVTDLAGNVAEPYDSGEFVIDMTAPEVRIGNVANETAYADKVAPTVDFSDTNFDPVFATVTLKGARRGDVYDLDSKETDQSTSKHVAYADFPHELDVDDVYTMEADVVDLAGNESKQAVTFSVNRYGSNYYFVGDSAGIEGSYLNGARDVKIAEVNVSGIETDKSHAETVHDSRVSSLEAGRDYERDANADSKGWSQTTYTFPAKLFEEDGYYRILLTSRDRAGNLSQNSMTGKDSKREGAFDVGFAVDGTAPEANLIGIDSNGVYLDPAKSMDVDAHDNLAVARAELTVDGKKVASWKAGDLEGKLPGTAAAVDGKPHTYVLTVTDRAGNKSRAVYDGVVVTGDWLTFVLNTPRLLYGSVAGVAALATAVAVIAYLAVRHRRLTEARRNPFGRGGRADA